MMKLLQSSTALKEKKLWHLRAIVVACMLVISFTYGFQHLLWLHEIGWDYKNAIFPSFFRAPDSYHYIAQIKEIYEGNTLLSNSYLAEYKNTEKSVWPLLPFYLMTWTARLLHLKISSLIVLMDFLLPPFVFLLAFGFLYCLSSHRKISLFGAFLLAMTPHLLWLEHTLSTVLRILIVGPPFLADAHCYHCYSRPINPQLTYPFLLAALLFFVKFLTTAKYRYAVSSLFFGALVSYTYVYFSTYLYTFLGVVTIAFLFLKMFDYFRKALFIFISTVLIAIPFWLSVFSFSDTALNQVSWVYKDRTPILDNQLLLTVPLCLLILLGLSKKFLQLLPGITALALLLSGFICLNQHVITSMNTQPEWHYNMFIRPQSVILAMSFLLAEFVRIRKTANRLRISWFQKFSTESLLWGGGLVLIPVGGLFHPSLVASHFSPDGNLSSKFIQFLQLSHFAGIGVGILLIVTGFLMKTSFRVHLQKSAQYCIKQLQQGRKKIVIPRAVKLFLYLVIGAYLSIDVAMAQYSYYQSYIVPRFSDLQQLAPALKWLNTHTEKESVVLGSFDYASTGVLTIYTENNVYLSIHAQFYSVPLLDELRDRLYNLLFFMGVRSEDEFDSELSRHIFLENLSPSYTEYQQKLQQNLYAELTKYRVDYLLYGPREKQSFLIVPEDTYSFLRKVFDDGTVTIFQIL